MNDIIKRREISARIADPADIPIYRKLLKAADSPYAGYIDTNKKKLAILLVSALLQIMTEEDILRAVKEPATGPKTAAAPEYAPTLGPAKAAVKKKPSRRPYSIRTSAGRIWTIPSSGLRTLSSRMQSIWAAGSAKLKTAWETRKRLRSSSQNT